jgi:hypothetical protein
MRYGMKLYLTFEAFWNDYRQKTLQERQGYFRALSRREQSRLIDSFFADGWHEVVVQNVIDERLDYIKTYYGIDLIELRLQAIRLGKVFLVDRQSWEEIEQLILEFDNYYNSDIVFGDLVVSNWGRQKQFCKIRANRRC